MVVCLESVTHHTFMSAHSKVKHGVAEEVNQKTRQGWVMLIGGSVDGVDCRRS